MLDTIASDRRRGRRIVFLARRLHLWCVTGLVMWWQMRKLRRVGLVVMVSALVASLWVLGGVLPGLAS